MTDREIVRFRFFCMSEYPIDAIFLSSSHFYKCLVIVNSLSPPKDFKWSGMREFQGLSFVNLVRIQVEQIINFGTETVQARAGPEAASVGNRGNSRPRPPLCTNSVPRISVDHWVRGVWAYYYLGFRPRRPLALHGLGQYLSQSLFSDQLVF